MDNLSPFCKKFPNAEKQRASLHYIGGFGRIVKEKRAEKIADPASARAQP